MRSNETSPAFAEQGALAMPSTPPCLPNPALPLPVEGSSLIHDAVLARAAEQPEALALAWHEGACTYGQLAQISRTLAQLLLSRGVQQGDTVAIYGDRNPALVYCMLAVLRAGAAFQLVDAAYPAPRIVACLRQSAPTFVLLAGALPVPEALGALPAFAREARVVRVPASAEDALGWLAQASDDAQALPIVDPSALAYVSFTSGSTGTPKGILTAHAPLPHFVAWHVAHGALTASDRFSMLSGLSHDPLLRDVFTPLSIGASLHIPTQSMIFDADALWTWFAQQRITVAHMTPALGEILTTGAPEAGELPALRRVYWGGDVLKPRLVTRIAALAPSVSQTNFYGATETPQAMAYFDLAASRADDDTIPIGHGIDGAQLLVMRDDGALATVGESGEIWIRSPYLSLGYLGDAAQTRARFVANPFVHAAGDLCYRTGDRGRYREDGAVLYAGRADHQLKIRGFRVEPAEIATAIERAAGVQRAAVLGSDVRGEKQLTGYVVLEGARTLDAAQLRDQLLAQLPSYMVPKYFVQLERLPLLPNGKVDLQALPPPVDDAVAVPRTGRRLPRSEAERQMAQIWAEILGVDEVGIDESFLDLGGDSLAAIRALSRMRRLGIRDEIARGIFQGRTIAELTDDTGPVNAERPPLRGTAKVTLLINVLRGLLVLTLVFDHWREGLFKRLPFLPLPLVQSIEPLFHLPTPGFAFVFGIGLGHSHYETFLKNPAASRRLLGGGALLLGLGTVLMALSRNLGVVARGLPLDYDLFFTNFFLPTLYYWMALVTAPLWFWLIARRENRWGGNLAAALALALASRCLYEVCRFLLVEHEQKGLLQLGRLMLTARFSYFNLSTGALLGVSFGLLLRRERMRESLASPLARWGGLLLGAGVSLYLVQRERYPEGLVSADIYVPEWLFYTGATLLIGALTELVILRTQRSPIRRVLEWIGVVGQCAMPIFILQGMALDVSAFGRALGLRDALAVLVSLASFVLSVGWMMSRIHGLYYGTISAREPRAQGGAAAL